MKRNDVMRESYKLKEVNDRGLAVCTSNQTLLLCGAGLDYTREKGKMTQEGRGCKSKKMTSGRMVVLCGCAACRTRGCGL